MAKASGEHKSVVSRILISCACFVVVSVEIGRAHTFNLHVEETFYAMHGSGEPNSSCGMARR